MACKSCSINNKNYTKQTESVCSTNASDIQYTGPNLSCLGVQTNSNLDEVFSNINNIVCSEITIDWSSFNYACLEGGSTAKDFVEEISAEFCSLETDVNTFLGTTFPSYQSAINSRFIDIEIPEVESICSINGITISDSDNIQTVLQKLSNISCYLSVQLNPSSANWSSCYTVSPTPTTIVGGFNTLISQICSIKSTVDGWTGLLPTFNNIGTCLPTPSATESLYNTVVKIRNKACAAITYDVDEVTWQTCVGNPTATAGTTIEDTISHLTYYIEQSILNRITSVSSDFNLTLTTPGSPCDGLKLEFNPGGTFANNLVALDVDDTAGFLLDKLTAGSNITFDTVTNEGEIIINASVGTDQYARVTSNDTTSDYLNNKIQGSTGEITISTTVIGSGNESLQISGSLNSEIVADNILDAILLDSALQSKFCSAVSNCNITPVGNSSTFYVSSRQTGSGDGTPTNPFSTIDEAYNAVIGSGSANTPQYNDSTIYVFKGVYSTSINGYIRGISYHFEPGTVLNNVSTEYFIEADSSNTFDKPIYITGGLIFNSFTGGLLKIVRSAVSAHNWNTAVVELSQADYTVGALSSPTERPFIHMECLSPNSTWGRPRLDLKLEGTIFSNGQTIINCVNGPVVSIEGGPNGGFRLDIPSASTANAFRWVFGGSNTSYAANSRFTISNIVFAGKSIDSLIYLQGFSGFSTIRRCSTLAVGSGTTLKRLIFLNDFRPIDPDGLDELCVIDNFIVSSYSGFTDADIVQGTRTNSQYNRINFKDCVLPTGFYIDKTNINFNLDIGCAQNVDGGFFNISNVPNFADESAAISGGLKSGDIYRLTSGNALQIVI